MQLLINFLPITEVFSDVFKSLLVLCGRVKRVEESKSSILAIFVSMNIFNTGVKTSPVSIINYWFITTKCGDPTW